MLKNKKSKSTAKATSTSLGKHLIILYAAVITLLAAVLILGAYVKFLSKHSDDTNYFTTRTLIKSAVEGLYKPTIVEPQTKQQYVYEANLRFPAADASYNNFRYAYTAGDEAFKTSLELTTTALLGSTGGTLASSEKLFDGVPQYQRCSRLFAIHFEPGIDTLYSFDEAGTKKLADGRTVYFYKNNSCSKLYKEMRIDVAAIEALFTQVQSY